MITIFNRRELFVTLSMEKQMEIRQRLEDAGINYVLRTKNLTGNGHTGQLGIHASWPWSIVFTSTGRMRNGHTVRLACDRVSK